MKKKLMLTLLPCILLSACGGGGSNDDIGARAGSTSDVNVASSVEGATAVSAYDSANTGNLIDGNTETYWTSDPDFPIVVTFAKMESINKIRLTRTSAPATIGTDPDILIEISDNGVDYTDSNVSVVSGGIPCTSQTVNSEVMECNMAQESIRSIRITTQNGNAHELIELEAIARK